MDTHSLTASTRSLPNQRVLAISGSLRSGSWNLRLLRAAAEHAPEGMTIDVCDSLLEVPLFNEDLEHRGVPAAVRDLRAQVNAADGVLIATPEYNQSIPGVLKNLLDWLSRASPDEPLANKPVAVIGASSGRWGTRLAQHALRQTLVATESLVLPAPALYIRDAPSLFDAERLVDTATLESLRAVLGAFSQWMARNPNKAGVASLA